jgi:cell division protein FtsL
MNFPKGWIKPDFEISGIDKNNEYYTVEFHIRSIREFMNHPMLRNSAETKFYYEAEEFADDLIRSTVAFTEKLMRNLSESLESGKALKIPRVVFENSAIRNTEFFMSISISTEISDDVIKARTKNINKAWNRAISLLNNQIEYATRIMKMKVPEYDVTLEIAEKEEKLSEMESKLKDTERENRELKRKLDRIKELLN